MKINQCFFIIENVKETIFRFPTENYQSIVNLFYYNTNIKLIKVIGKIHKEVCTTLNYNGKFKL